MAAILHITKPGHRCPSRLKNHLVPAKYIQAGEVLGLGTWQLFWVPSRAAYLVVNQAAPLDADYYEFSNFNCATSKLIELGRK